MDLEKYINENIDDIIDNPSEFIFDKFQTNTNKKKIVSFENININNNNDDYNDDDYYDKIYGDVYDNDFDDFGFVYPKNSEDSSDSLDTENLNNYDDKYLEPNEDDYTEDIIGDLYQDKYENIMNDEDVFEAFTNTNKNTNTNIITNKNTNIIANKNANEIDNEFYNDDGYYFINLINIFIKYYNNKFDKIENFFSGINDTNNYTSYQMELFFESITEYNIVKKFFNLNDIECMKLIYMDSNIEINQNNEMELNSSNNSDKILELFSKWDNQIYMLDFGINRFISPSLLVCLNYIYENKMFDDYWNIYNLRNIE